MPPYGIPSGDFDEQYNLASTGGDVALSVPSEGKVHYDDAPDSRQ